MLTIDQILGVSYKPALKAAKDGRRWVSDDLENLHKHGRIKIAPLGPTYKNNPIQEISVPCVWTHNDDLKNSTENQKVNLVYQLLKNGWYSHDDLLEEKIKKSGKKAVVSHDYRYANSGVMKIVSQNAYLFRIYTAFALVDEF